MSNKFVWTDEYSVGVVEIDEQHKKFLDICNSLLELEEGESFTSEEALEKVTDAYNSMDSGLTPEEQVRLYKLYTKQIQELNNSDIRNCK